MGQHQRKGTVMQGSAATGQKCERLGRISSQVTTGLRQEDPRFIKPTDCSQIVFLVPSSFFRPAF